MWRVATEVELLSKEFISHHNSAVYSIRTKDYYCGQNKDESCAGVGNLGGYIGTFAPASWKVQNSYRIIDELYLWS